MHALTVWEYLWLTTGKQTQCNLCNCGSSTRCFSMRFFKIWIFVASIYCTPWKIFPIMQFLLGTYLLCCSKKGISQCSFECIALRWIDKRCVANELFSHPNRVCCKPLHTTVYQKYRTHLWTNSTFKSFLFVVGAEMALKLAHTTYTHPVPRNNQAS